MLSVIKNNLNPSWKPFKIPIDLLCRGDYDRTLKFEVNNWNSDGSADFIGECTASLRDLTGVESSRAVQTTFDLIKPNLQWKNGAPYKSGVLSFNKVNVQKTFRFLDYIIGGTNLTLAVAVDFTQSNGHPQEEGSLHHIKSHVPNQYEQVSCLFVFVFEISY